MSAPDAPWVTVEYSISTVNVSSTVGSPSSPAFQSHLAYSSKIMSLNTCTFLVTES
jgi:hypothetical protein